MYQKQCEDFQRVLQGCICSTRAGESVDMESSYRHIFDLLLAAKQRAGTVYLLGNGGSAAVASHLLVDLINVAHLRAAVLHEPSVFTCGANDYGYADAYGTFLKKIGRPEDLLVAISSSGKSPNILNAVRVMQTLGGKTITLTGFHPENPIRQEGDLNIWLNSQSYREVEVGHLFFMHSVMDHFRHAL